MLDELETLARWEQSGRPFALASVVRTSRSAPRPPGAALAVHSDGTVIGSVSGGCVEAAVVQLCEEVLATGLARRASYGISDADALNVGLTCGGTIEVFVRLVGRGSQEVARLGDEVRRGVPAAMATVLADPVGDSLRGDTVVVGTDDERGGGQTVVPARAAVEQVARSMLQRGESGLRVCPREGSPGHGIEVFVQSFLPQPRFIIIGAMHVAPALATVAAFLGFSVTVCDPRSRFVTRARFPDADELATEWPQRYVARQVGLDARTAICVLTHDPKLDVPALLATFRTPCGYIGALGSRRTHDDRIRRLRDRGASGADLARLHSPIGLDLGGRSLQETALSIASEVVAVAQGGSGRPLSAIDGAIHQSTAAGGPWSSHGPRAVPAQLSCATMGAPTEGPVSCDGVR